MCVFVSVCMNNALFPGLLLSFVRVHQWYCYCCSCCCSRHFNFRLFAVILAAKYVFCHFPSMYAHPYKTKFCFFCSHGFSKWWRFTTKLHFVEFPKLAARIRINWVCKVHLYWLFGVLVAILCFHGSLKREEEKERIFNIVWRTSVCMFV